MNVKRLRNISLALFINAGIITACSTNQMPGTTSSNTGSSYNQSTPAYQEQITVNTEVQDSIRDDETTIKDSETVAAEMGSFSTLAKKEKEDKLNKNSNDSKVEKSDKKLAANLGKQMREQILEDRVKLVKAQIKVHESKLKLLKDVKKSLNLKRKDANVKNSDVVEIQNADGTTSKIMTVKFENKTGNNIRENKVVKTFSSDGKLIKMEHYLTVDLNNLDRTYTKIVEYNTDGSKKVVVKSETKWADGKSRIVSEERNINADGSGTGFGTVTITSKDGTVKTYEIKVTISQDGEITTEPVTSPSPSPSVSPTPSVSPSPTATATVEPTPTATATADPTPTATATVSGS